MKKQQTLIMDIDDLDFKKTVNRHLLDGWTVVPGTLVISGNHPGEGYTYHWKFAVVLEKNYD